MGKFQMSYDTSCSKMLSAQFSKKKKKIEFQVSNPCLLKGGFPELGHSTHHG